MNNHDSRMKLLNLKEAKEFLGIGDWMLYQLLRTNKLPSVKIGGRRLISLRAIEKYIIRLEEESEANGNYRR